MRVGFIGLGKLGVPVAAAIADRGHEVVGYDLRADALEFPFPHEEVGPDGHSPFNDYFHKVLQAGSLRMGTMDEIVEGSDIIFVAVETPHEPLYEGVTRVPETRKDFDYTALEKVADAITVPVRKLGKITTVVVISTVLPGTMERDIIPRMNDRIEVVYNPFFIAMGQVVPDFLHPEFILVGSEHERALVKVRAFYESMGHKGSKLREMSIKSAELTKVAYNTAISGKICFANTMMEICHRVGANVDDVMGALKSADDRLISPAYLTAGMGDGGGCHPRDNIAMSWFANELEMLYDPFDFVMQTREHQAEWLCSILEEESEGSGLPICVAGTAFKAGVRLTTGSSSLLCVEILEEWGHDVKTWDPIVEGVPMYEAEPLEKGVFLVGCNHRAFEDLDFPEGSVVVDPWGIVQDQEGVRVVRVGRR